jgi:hypothetical protein
MNAQGHQFMRSAHIIFVVGVSTIDQDVACLQQRFQGLECVLRDLPRRQHHPNGPGLGQLLDQISQAMGTKGTQVHQWLDTGRTGVVDHTTVSLAEQTANQIAPHLPQTNHANVHY